MDRLGVLLVCQQRNAMPATSAILFKRLRRSGQPECRKGEAGAVGALHIGVEVRCYGSSKERG